MANWNPTLVTPTQTSAPASGSGVGPAGGAMAVGSVQPHHGLITIVLVAAGLLFVLNYAGFRFVFTAGKR